MLLRYLNDTFRSSYWIRKNKHRIFSIFSWIRYIEYFNNQIFLTKIETKLPPVTFVLSVYNNEQYLEEALRSIDLLTYPVLDLIIFNDCSPDNSKTIIDRFKFNRSFRNLTIIHSNTNFNKFLFNEIVNKVQTDYVVYGCDDDIQNANRIELQIRYMISQNSYLCTGDAIVINEYNQNLGRSLNPFLNSKGVENLIVDFYSNFSFGATTTFHMNLFHEFGPLHGDLQEIDFILPFRCFLLENTPVRVPFPVIRWRKHRGNMSADNPLFIDSQKEKIRMNRLKNLEEMKRLLYLVKHDLKDSGRLSELIHEEHKKYAR